MTSRHDLEKIRSRICLSQIIGQRVRLTGKRDKFGLCPFHRERTPSFSVRDDRRFYFCFGCGERGDVFDWFMRAEGLTFAEAIERARGAAGQPQAPAATCGCGAPVPNDNAETARRQAAVRAIWNASRPIAGTIAEVYLREARAVTVKLPDCLRCHPGLPFDLPAGDALPALVAAVTDLAGELVAVQRTWLRTDGSGKADIRSPKRSLGPVRRGAVCMGPPATTLGLAEGIETALSAAELYRLPVWASLGCANLPRVRLPAGVRNVVIFADRGAVGEQAAESARAAFHEQRRRVVVRFPQIGQDFNDELKARRRGR
jgi:DNA primase